ncbi:hypothetical protein [Microbacterium stercoris]|uniref:Transcriptional regulator, AbiEi antitoxin, Type IV TA system n=1 Tax=Microbacterium stercoris TaxID=2820289 RepID=A0A939QFK0_9MICO|nr:hypothetical protein [Microbacterium stercoris]MBO3662017.1 hypothetical protein [Microbacterium stercoris]
MGQTRDIRASDRDVRLLTLRELELRGSSPDAVRREIGARRLVRVRRGHFAASAEWDAQFVEGRQRARSRAYAAMSPSTVFAFETAASHHALPLFRVKEERLHTVCTGRAASSTRNVLRHRTLLPESDIVVIDGIRVSSLSRTVSDMIRKLPFEAGVALADAALGAAERTRRGGAEELRGLVAERLARASGGRGVRKARVVIAFADERSGSPGESASRWLLRVIGFRSFELQVPFTGPDGQRWFVDLGFDGNLGEFDGAVKYTDPAFLDGRTSHEALLDEKERGDWIRGHSGAPFVRWMDAHIKTPETLRARLEQFGIRP